MTKQILNSLRLYFGLSDTELTAETSFRHDLGWDEIDIFEAFFSVEQDYDVELSDEEADQIDSVEQLVNRIKLLYKN